MVVKDVRELDFEEEVIRRSFQIPVVVDFWSLRCGPCRVLGPLLEGLAREMEGRFVLVKVDVDQAPQLAQALQVMAVPTVKVIREGKLVDEFSGAQPKEAVRAFLDRACPSQADSLVDQGKGAEALGDWDKAGVLYQRALSLHPGHPGARLGMARVALAQGDLDQVAPLLEGLPPAYQDEADEILSALMRHKEAASMGGEADCRRRLSQDPGDLDARYCLAMALAAKGHHAEALEQLFTLLETNKDYKDGEARKSVLHLFSLLGPESDLVKASRTRLASILY